MCTKRAVSLALYIMGSARAKSPDVTGLLEAVKSDIMAELLYLPLSPPTSETRTSSGAHTPTERLNEVDHSTKRREDETKQATTTLTVFSSTETTSSSSPHRLTVHLLPPSSADVVATVTNGFLKASVKPDDISSSMLKDGIRGMPESQLHLSTLR